MKTVKERFVILTEFVNGYNIKWNEKWLLEERDDYVEIYRDEPMNDTADGHFIKKLMDFCEERGLGLPCLAWSSLRNRLFFFK